MAYDRTKPPALAVQGINNSTGPKSWLMAGTDPDTTVDGSGYITNARALGMKVGDLVYYTNLSANPIANYIFNVSVINTDGSADLSNSTPINSTNSD